MIEGWSQTIDLMMKHHSVRKYKDEPIPRETLLQIIHAAQHAASSNFVQAYSVIHVTDHALKEKIAVFSRNEQQIRSAPVFLLFCGDLKRNEYACRKHMVRFHHDTLENFIVVVIDVALFAQNVALAAESLGYGICYIGGVRNNPAQISDIVGLPDKTFPLFGMTIGVPDDQEGVKPRLMVDAIVHENYYDEKKYQLLIDQYDEVMANYYRKRRSNKKETNWSETMAAFFSEARRSHMCSFIASKGFTLSRY